MATYALLAIAVGLAGASPAFAQDSYRYCVGNFVWHDLDGDGIQDSGEPGVGGVVVTAYDCVTGAQLDRDTTDGCGKYRVCWCNTGDANPFRLVFTLPEGYAFTLQDQGADDTKDSDVDAFGRTACFDWPSVARCTCAADAGLVVITCPPGTGTPGYWKNHLEAWPVNEITIGGVPYPMTTAIDYMKSPAKKDKTYTMFPALVAAMLNVLAGNDSSCISDIIVQADE